MENQSSGFSAGGKRKGVADECLASMLSCLKSDEGGGGGKNNDNELFEDNGERSSSGNHLTHINRNSVWGEVLNDINKLYVPQGARVDGNSKSKLPNKKFKL